MRHAAGVSLLAALLLPAGVSRLAAQASADVLVAGATASAPDSMRAGATVLAPEGGRWRVVRQGGNGLVCVADDPTDKSWSTACYHESLEPFMARGRELKAQKKTRADIDAARLADVEAKRYTVPAAVVYNIAGSAEKLGPDGIPTDAERWYVVYLPYATTASSGLSLMPDGTGRPWLMYPGKPWAHAMITPTQGK